MFLNDIDQQFLKSVNFLYSGDNVGKGETYTLQSYLEEAIKNKTGTVKDFSAVVSSSLKLRKVTEFKPFISVPEESKGSSSDNELELDLFKEDLMCIVCSGMDFGARNRLLECSECHKLYHQECHIPPVTDQDSFNEWICQSCKDEGKKLKMSTSVASPSSVISSIKISSSSPSSSSSSKSNSSTHRHSSSSTTLKSTSSLPKAEKYVKSNSSSSSKSSSSNSSSTSKPATSSSSTTRTTITPNINIICADKRIQIMKKKAAKLHEKRKHSSR